MIYKIQIPKILYGTTSFAKFHTDIAELNKIKWTDPVKGNLIHELI